MMNKRSSEGVPCTYCDNTAVAGTEPPMCEQCLKDGLKKDASADNKPNTLKELDASVDIR